VKLKKLRITNINNPQ
jgi:hypothetical protein